MYSRYVENDFGGTNNVKQEEYKPAFSDIVDLVRDEWNSYSKDGDIGYAKAAALVDKAIEPQVNQQVVQALQQTRIKIVDLDQMYEPNTIFDPAIGILDEAIKEYKGE